MTGILARLFASNRKPPLPASELAAFKTWFFAQRRPAVALIPYLDRAIDLLGSRLGGPAWLAEGEDWPRDARGVPLEFVAQLACADCRTLAGYPLHGVIQFFVGRDDYYGVDFDDLLGGSSCVKWYDAALSGSFHAPPPLEIVDGHAGSEFSPFQDLAKRASGVFLIGEATFDTIDALLEEFETRTDALYDRYDVTALDAFLETTEALRPRRHHTGGYPAFTQSDVRSQSAFAEHDHVLLRLTSDATIMWGDVGEGVFLIRSDDLKRKDFSRVAFSWDCS